MIGDYQKRVGEWMRACFSPGHIEDKKQRAFRFGEEALELLQAAGTTREEVQKLLDYVYARPIGEVRQEVGGGMITLAAFCSAYGLQLSSAQEDELLRCWCNIEKIKAKQAAKDAALDMSPLPGPTTQGWPFGCYRPSSCARNKICGYVAALSGSRAALGHSLRKPPSIKETK